MFISPYSAKNIAVRTLLSGIVKRPGEKVTNLSFCMHKVNEPIKIRSEYTVLVENLVKKFLKK